MGDGNEENRSTADSFGSNVNRLQRFLSQVFGVPLRWLSGSTGPLEREDINLDGRSSQCVQKAKALDEYKARLVRLNEQEGDIDQVEKEIKQSQKVLKQMDVMLKNLDTSALIVGEVVSRAQPGYYVVQLYGGAQYLVAVNQQVDTRRLEKGCRVAMDPTTHIIMTCLPRLININLRNMIHDGSSLVTFKMIGGLTEQIQSIREVVEFPLTRPEVFKRVGIKSPQRILLYGPPGTGKTMMAKAVASQIKCNFIKICGSGIIDKYIGESAKLIRDMFAYAKNNMPCIIFIDEIDAIGGKRAGSTGSADREIQRCMLELLHQLDGFNSLDKISVIMATNRPDMLDPALLRPGRMDRKLEIPLPNEVGRLEILQIHARNLATDSALNLSKIAQVTNGLNGADLRRICTEAGYVAIRDDRSQITQDDMMTATRKVMDSKLLEKKLDYKFP